MVFPLDTDCTEGRDIFCGFHLIDFSFELIVFGFGCSAKWGEAFALKRSAR